MSTRSHASGVVVFALVASVAAGAQAQTVANVAARGACSTSGVQSLSNQLVTVQMCAMPGVFVPITPHTNVTLTSSSIHAFMLSTARAALWSASSHLNIQINSAFRTIADQYVLYHSGACALAATPGNSNHETGRAIDVSNYSAALGALTNAGCVHSYPSSDPVHFDCPGSDMRAESIRAFQHLWNVNNPGDRIAEDGAYGPATDSRLARSPANGFATGGTCAPPTPDWGASYVAQSFPLASAGALTMHAGENVTAWIQLRNTGARTWDSRTHLATTVPRDRTSPFAAPGWISSARPAGVTGTIAPNGTYRFTFTLHAPATPGNYTEHFGVVEEGVAWFSDSGQGGPADTLLEARITVLPPIATDAGTPSDAGMPTDDVAVVDDVVPVDDVASADDASADDASADDVAIRDDASNADAHEDVLRGDVEDSGMTRLPDGALVPSEMAGGCQCSVPGATGAAHSRGAIALAAMGAAMLVARRRSRRDRTKGAS